MWNLNKKKRFLLDIIIILCWMGIVFTFSAQPGRNSTNLSGSIAEKIVNIVHRNDDLTSKEKTELTKKYNRVLRKLAHYTIYLLGGIAIISFINSLMNNKKLTITLTILSGFVYALSDEIHQSFTPGRDPRITDVLIDTSGVITGVIIYIVILAIAKKTKKKNKVTKEVI